MKKTISMFLLLVLCLSLCACDAVNDILKTIDLPTEEHIQSTDSDSLAGTWKLVEVVIEGVTFSTNELILMGQLEETYDYSFVLKDGGLGIDTEGDSFSWSVTDDTIIIDGMECLLEDGIISLVGENSTLKMQKISANQDISKVIASTETKAIVTVETTSAEEAPIVEDSTSELVDGMRPEFKEAMDAYEEFYDEYCAFMEKYQKNPLDMTLLFKYTEMLTKLGEMDKAFESWNEEDLNNTELKYYLDVNNRVTQKMVDVVG